MANNYRPGSRIAQVYAVYESNGPEAAEAKCDELGLAPATKKNWIGTWEREKARKEGKATPRKQTKCSERVRKPKQPGDVERAIKTQQPNEVERPKYTARANIKVLWTKRPARLAHKGEQCSEIVWLDTGSRQTLPNDQIVSIKGEL